MVTVPHRLLENPAVSCLVHLPDLIILDKHLMEPMYEQQSYVSMHALSIVRSGQQVVYGQEGKGYRFSMGKVGLMRRGLYTISDLLPKEQEGFETTVVFFSEEVLQSALNISVKPSTAPQQAIHVLRCGQSIEHWTRALKFGLCDIAAQDLPMQASVKSAFAKQAFTNLITLLVGIGGESSEQALLSLLKTPKQPIREFMEKHCNKPLTLQDYALLSGRSERSFRRDFKARFGVGPKQWIVERRLERAREILQDTRQSVSSVAAEVGYTSTSHFIEVFQRRWGVTPGQV